MANNKITIDISLDDNGSMRVVAKEAKKTAKSIDGVTKSTDRNTAATKRNRKGKDSWNRQAKGTAQNTSNSTKAFSKQAQSIGGQLVPAYATLAANVFALTALFGALKRAAALEQLEAGLIAVGAAAGQNLPYVAQGLKDIAGAAVSIEQAMSATALGMSSGFSAEKLRELTVVAKGASLALGRDMGDALTRLVKGTAKLEPEILDELGIMVRLDDAAAAYASTLKKSVTELTMFEKRQAFLIATTEQGVKKFGDLSEAVEVNPFDQLAASFNDLTLEIFGFLNVGLGPIVKFFSQSKWAILGAMTLFGSIITKTMLPALNDVLLRTKMVANSSHQDFTLAAKKSTSAFSRMSKNITSLEFMPKGIKTLGPAMQAGTLGATEMTAAIKTAGRSVSGLQGRVTLLHNTKVKETAAATKLGTVETKAHVVRMAQLDAEIAAVRVKIKLNQEGIAQMQAASTASTAKSEISNKGARAQTTSRMTNINAVALDRMSKTTSTVKQIKFANIALMKNLKIVRTTTGAVNILSASWTAGAGAVKLYGMAALNFLPVLGQIILVMGVLYPLVSKLWEKSGLAKKTDEVVKSFESFDKAAGDLFVKINKEGTEAHVKYVSSLKVEIGAIQQLIDGIKELQSLKNAEHYAAEAEALTAVWEAQKLINDERAKGNNISDRSTYAMQLKQMQASLKKIQGEETELTGMEAAPLLLAGMGKMAALSSAVSDDTKKNMVDLAKRINDAMLSGKNFEAAPFVQELEDINHPLEVVVNALTDAPAIISAFNKELTKLEQKDTTVFDDVSRSISSLVNNIKGAASDASVGLDAWVADNEATAKDIGDIYKRMGGSFFVPDPGSYFGSKSADVEDQAKAIEAYTKNNIALLQKNAGVRNQLLVAQKNLNKISAQNGDIMTVAIDNELKLLTNAQNKLQIEDDQNWALHKQVLNTEKILALEFAINDVIRTRATKIEVAEVKGLQRINKLHVKRVAFNKSIMDSSQKILRNILAINAAQSNSDINPQAEAAIWESEKASKLEFINLELKYKKEAIDLEYRLMGLQLTLEQARLDASLARKEFTQDEYETISKSITDIAALTKITGASAAGAADNAASLARSNIEATSAAKERARINDIERQKDARAAIVASTLRAVPGREGAALNVEDTRLEESKFKILGELETATKKLSEAEKYAGITYLMNAEQRKATDAALVAAQQVYADKVIELSENELAILDKKIEKYHEIASEMQRLGGDILGSFGEAVAMLLSNDVAGAFAGTFSEAMTAAHLSMQPLIESLRSISPEGALMASITTAAFSIGEVWSQVGEDFSTLTMLMNAGIATTEDKMKMASQVLGAVASTINQIAQIQAAASASRIAGIESEIAAEQKRDGKSAASVAKLASLEKKKEAAKKKAFEVDKKMKMASTVMATAAAIMQVMSQGGLYAIPIAIMVGAMGAMQLAAIAATSYQGGGASASASIPSSVSVGERGTSVDLATSRSASGDLAYARGEQGVSNGANFVPTFTGRSAGGNAALMVGEQGPELFIPERPGTILPADESEDFGGQIPNVNFTINTIDSQGMEEALVKQQDNIIKMIRGAANARGEFFLEGVD